MLFLLMCYLYNKDSVGFHMHHVKKEVVNDKASLMLQSFV